MSYYLEYSAGVREVLFILHKSFLSQTRTFLSEFLSIAVGFDVHSQDGSDEIKAIEAIKGLFLDGGGVQ